MPESQDYPLLSFPLPSPDPELLREGNPDEERKYFDPERWNGELARWKGSDDGDPVTQDRGRCAGQGSAAVFFSDFHMADGTTGGDDFLESHLHRHEKLGLYVGSFPAGRSRARRFVSVLTFIRQRLAEQVGPEVCLDVVLNGDLINGLELLGRGGTFVSSKHKLFFRALARLRSRADVYWLRGNHDYAVPSGPWQAGEFYVNEALQVLAEHGDFWDKENWPPGPLNKGSKVLIEGGSAFEVHGVVLQNGELAFLMAGVDNLRPWSNDAIEGFLDRRARHSTIAGLTALLARVKYLGAADDSAAFAGAQERRAGRYADWLMVQGHTHVPALVPNVYHNTGTWIATLLANRGEEQQLEAFPFLLVYRDRSGKRVEEYYLVQQKDPDSPARVELQTQSSINALRRSFGYKDIAT